MGVFILLVAPAHCRPEQEAPLNPLISLDNESLSIEHVSEKILPKKKEGKIVSRSFLDEELPNNNVQEQHELFHHSCPNCVHPKNDQEQKKLDNLRIENIKQQILSKLGLKSKPNISTSIPRDVLLQTLYRSDDTRPLLKEPDTGSFQDEAISYEDDYYAKTSEIISFAEPGELKLTFFIS